MTGGIDSGRFDRELSLTELLRSIDMNRLAESLASLLGGAVRLDDAGGTVILAAGNLEQPRHAALMGELESIGMLYGAADEQRLRGAAELLRLILRANARYLMASELHTEVIHNDYEELQRKHVALQESEARYKSLAEQLEQRVAEQVQTIETAQRKLYQSEKLAAVGQLAAGVAHEINNPISFVKSNLNSGFGYVKRLQAFGNHLLAGTDTAELTQLWKKEQFDVLLQDFGELLAESDDGIGRVAAIVADLKGFSRVDQLGDEEADLNEVITRVCNVAAARLRERAELKLELGTLPRLRCNAAQLGQVFLNLLLNATDAVTPLGEIGIRSEVVGNQLCVSVSDNGVGIAPEVLPRVFEPFFTTKAMGSGTGLGLTVSNDIVKVHGGHIDIDSRPGHGTVVTVWLPLGYRSRKL